jgi:hypothetical protein
MIVLESTGAGAIEIRTADESGLDPDTYNAFIAALQLTGIELVKIQGERTSPGASSQNRFGLSAGYMLDGEKIHYRYDVTAHFLDDTGKVLGNASASVLLVASGACTFSAACFDRFGATSGALMVHPYLREAISSTSQRIGFPGILLPMMTYQPDTPDPE